MGPQAADAQSILPEILLAGGMLVIIAVLMLRLRKRTRRGRTESRAQTETRVSSARTDQSVAGLEAQTVDRFREVAAKADARIRQLELLLAQADERIAELGAEPLSTPRVQGVVPVRTRAARAEAAPSAASQNGVKGPIGAPKGEDPARIKAAVAELRARGQSPAAIAQELGVDVGVVELIVALEAVSETLKI